MIVRIKLVFAFLLLSSAAFSQDMARVRQNIQTLTSPAMHGRGYVQAGDRKAAGFLQEQFSQMGLKTFGGSYLQHFTLDINTFPKKIKLKIGHTTLTTGKDYIVNPVSQKGRGSGRIVYLDTLIFTQEQARKQFMQSDFSKKVMVYEAKDYAHLVEMPTEYLQKMHEAKALIELQKDKLTASLSNKQLSHAAFEMVKKDLPKDAGKVRFRVDAELIKSYQSQNVIGYVEGKTEPDSFIVVSAHYDHLGMMGKDTYFPGANDNASGTAMLLELAHHYALPANQPDHSMVFIAFGAEEAGLVGSAYFTQHPLFPLKQIKFLINLDLVGTGDDGITVVNGAALTREFNMITAINQQHKYVPQINKRANAPNSDHFYFAHKGVKAIFIYALGGIKAYHDIYDRAESLPLTRFAEIQQLIQDFVTQIEKE